MNIAQRIILLVGTTFTMVAAAQVKTNENVSNYPNRPVIFVVWSSVGGTVDTFIRSAANRLSKLWGTSVVVENRPGASGQIATASVVAAPPDGYRVLITTTSSQILLPLTSKNLPYDPVKDLTPVSLLAEGSFAVVASSNSPYSNVSKMLTKEGGNAKSLTYGSVGTGSSGHIIGAYLSSNSFGNFLHVPYKGGETGMIADLKSGQLDFAVWPQGAAVAAYNSGLVKVLGVTGGKRIPALPAVPTFSEQKLAELGVSGWLGAHVRSGTPPAIVARVSAGLQEALKDESIRARLRDDGFDVIASTPAAFEAALRKDETRWRELMHSSGFSVEK